MCSMNCSLYADVGSIVNIQEGGVPISHSGLQKLIDSEIKGATKLAPLGFTTGERTRRYLLPFGEPYAALLVSC